MKKTIIILISAIILLLLIVGSIFYMISKDAMLIRNPLIVQQNPIVTYTEGESYYKPVNSDEWLPLKIGQKLEVGITLKTHEDGEIDIRFSANTLMKIDSSTILSITKNTLKNLSVKINNGRLFAKFHKLFSDQEFTVESGNAVAGIRGTDLVFEAYPERTEIYALSGITEIYNKNYADQKILLAFQKKTLIKNDAPPTHPVKMEPDEINKFQNILNSIHPEKVFLITNKIQFNANTTQILTSSLPELSIVLDAMKSKSFNIEIAGHTANIGSSSAMYSLSLLRAQAIKDYLVKEGISRKRLKIKGYGGSIPIADNNSSEGKAKNRRVEFIILD